MAMASLIPTILSSSIVFPSYPTPHHTLSLSENDQMMLVEGHVYTIYVYKKPSYNNPSPPILDSLRNSLSQILVPYYPLAGRLRRISGGRVELSCCAAGAQLIEAESFADLDVDYSDFTPSAATQQLVPKIDFTAPLEDQPLFVVQVTKFPCGGIVIGMAISHIVTDGVSAMEFINSWASIARGEKTKDTIIPIPNHERDFYHPLQPPRFDHEEYKHPPLLIDEPNVEEEHNKPASNMMLKLTKHQIEKLKKRANSEGHISQQNGRPYSRFEVVGGHIWVCAGKARNNDDKQPTRMLIDAGIRQRLTSPPPKGFFGNANLSTVTTICEFGELTRNPLSYVAGKIREGILRLTDEYIKSAMGLSASKDCEPITRTSFWGNPNLYLGCWTLFPFYDTDFGWGRPWYVGPSHLGKIDDGTSIIMSGPEKESLIVHISLQIKHMDEFKKLFYEDL